MAWDTSMLHTFEYDGASFTVWTTQNEKGHYIVIDSDSTWEYSVRIYPANDSEMQHRVRTLCGHSTLGVLIHGVSYKKNFDIKIVDDETQDIALHVETIYWS